MMAITPSRAKTRALWTDAEATLISWRGPLRERMQGVANQLRVRLSRSPLRMRRLASRPLVLGRWMVLREG
jgi:hypothetical protein